MKVQPFSLLLGDICQKSWCDNNVPLNFLMGPRRIWRDSLCTSHFGLFLMMWKKTMAGTTMFIFVVFPSDGARKNSKGQPFPVCFGEEIRSNRIQFEECQDYFSNQVCWGFPFVPFVDVFWKEQNYMYILYLCIFWAQSLEERKPFSPARTFERTNGLF